MSTLIGIREAGSDSANADGLYSPAKEKAANRIVYGGRSQPLLFRRVVHLLVHAKVKLLLALFVFFFFLSLTSKISPFMGWIPHQESWVSSPSRGGYTVLINTWKRNSLLKQSVGHYASCGGTDAIRVVWSENDPPSESLKAYLKRTVYSNSLSAHKPNFKFEINKEDNLNNRFKPIPGLRSEAIFSVDDDVIVPCDTLDFAFAVWQTAPSTMVGFVPRMHWLDEEAISLPLAKQKLMVKTACSGFLAFIPLAVQNFISLAAVLGIFSSPMYFRVLIMRNLKHKNGATVYKYGGWWSVWGMGTYSMVLSKAAFFHRKYLDLYTYKMPSKIRNYVTWERNCEDIAMSLLVANATGAPPIWVKGKIYEIGSSGISSLNGHSGTRNKCLNDFISLYGYVPLVSTNVKAVDARHNWFW